MFARGLELGCGAGPAPFAPTPAAPPPPAPAPPVVYPAVLLASPVPVPVGVAALDAQRVFMARSSAMIVATKSTLPAREGDEGGDEKGR